MTAPLDPDFGSALLDAAPGLLYATLPNGELIAISDALLARLGLQRERVLGHPASAWVDECDATTRTLRVADGHGVTVIHQRNPLCDARGKPCAWVHQLSDLTPQASSNPSPQSEPDNDQRVRALADFAPIGILETNPLGACTYTNPEWQRIYGLNLAQSLGDGWSATLHPDDREAVFAAWTSSAAAGQRFDAEFRVQQPGGATLLVHARAQAIRAATGDLQGYVGTVEDITQERRHALEIAELSRHLSLAYKATDLAVWSVDLRSWEVTVDARWDALYERDASQHVVDFEFWEHRVHPDDWPRVRAGLVGLANEHDRYEQHFRVQTPSGALRHLHSMGYVEHDSLGQALRVVGVSRDVTLAVHAQQAMQTAKEAAEQASKAKSQFVATMSHELRTPLNAVLGAAYLLEQSKLSDDQHRHLHTLRSSGEQLLGILNNVLDFAKIEAGKLELQPQRFDARRIWAAQANQLALLARGKGLALGLAVDEALPDYWLGDAQRFQQILTNLCSNAVKFTQSGHVCVEVNRLNHTDTAMTVQVTVRDSGIGIATEHQQRVFESFVQADSNINRRFGGTGLGLAITQQLVTLLGGSMSLISSPETGSCFTVTLPFGVPPDQSRQRPLEGKRAVLFDSDPQLRPYHYRALRALGLTITELPHDAEPTPHALLADYWVLHTHTQALEPPTHWLRARAQADRAPVMLVIRTDSGSSAQPNPIPLSTPAWQGNLLSGLINAAAPEVPRSAARSHGPLTGMHVLLVEDNLFNQTVACGMLEHAGATFDVASDGHSGLDRLRQMPQRYHVVLMDVHMPVLDGYRATRAIRDELKLAVPVVAMTAGVLDADRMACKQAGMNDFVPKPVDVELLVRVLSQWLPSSPDIVATESASPLMQAPETVPAINADLLIARMGNTEKAKQAVRTMLQHLVQQGTAPIDELTSLLASPEPIQAARSLHKWRGSIGSLNCAEFVAVCTELETAVRANESQRWPELSARFERAFRAVLMQSQAWLSLEARPPRNAQPVHRSNLNRLIVQLSERRIDALDTFDALAPELHQHLDQATFQTLRSAMVALEFDAALRVIRPLSESSDGPMATD